MPIDFPNSPTNGQEFTSGATTWTYNGTAWDLKTTTTASNDSMPVGSIMWFAGSTAPTGWVLCNGATYTNSTYPNLVAVIGTTFGGTPGANFMVPSISATTGAYYIRFTTAVGVTSTLSLLSAPVGSMVQWPVTSSYPTGWLRCDGSNISRTSYADLFALIGTTYGSGDGSSTFTLPNISAAGSGSPVYIIKATSSGLVEPSSVAHASSHVRGGTDIIDADRAQIDFVPSFYTRDSSPAQAGATTDLTAHLKGIDNKFTTGVVATGGTITTYTDYTGATYRVHSFTNTGNSSFTVTTGGICSALIVAGGGGGGWDVGGGGGAGGFIYRPAITLTPQTYTVTVGAGGPGATSSANSTLDGGSSSFAGITASGGGAGGSYASTNGRGGGSGGGGVGYGSGFSVPGGGTSGQGFQGGPVDISNASNAMTGSGGGGAGGPGCSSAYWSNGFVPGGPGRYCDITGTDVLYAEGGRGSADGWTGGTNTKPANSGNGGDGGGLWNGGANGGGAGAAGIVVIRYRIS